MLPAHIVTWAVSLHRNGVHAFYGVCIATRPYQIEPYCTFRPSTRSFEVSTNYVGFGPRDAKLDIGTAASRTAPSVPSFGLQAPSVAEGTHGSSTCLACGAEDPLWSASTAGTSVSQQPQSGNDVHPTPQTHAQPCYSQQKVDVATGEELPTDAMARVVPLDSLESEELSVSSGRPFDTGVISTGCRVNAHHLEQTSDVVDVDLRGCFFEEDTPQDRRQTVTVPAGSADLGAALVSDNVSCDIGVENVDVSAVNDLTGCELSFFGEERDDDDLCLSEGYLMDAVDALMASAPLDGEMDEETVGWV